jgi:hypothetical protein
MKCPTIPLAAVATRAAPGFRYYPKLGQLAALPAGQYLMKSN